MSNQTEGANQQDDSGSDVPWRIIGIVAGLVLLVCCGIPAGYCGIGSLYSVMVNPDTTYPDTPWRLDRRASGTYATGTSKSRPTPSTPV